MSTLGYVPDWPVIFEVTRTLVATGVGGWAGARVAFRLQARREDAKDRALRISAINRTQVLLETYHAALCTYRDRWLAEGEATGADGVVTLNPARLKPVTIAPIEPLPLASLSFLVEIGEVDVLRHLHSRYGNIVSILDRISRYSDLHESAQDTGLPFKEKLLRMLSMDARLGDLARPLREAIPAEIVRVQRGFEDLNAVLGKHFKSEGVFSPYWEKRSGV